MTKLLNGPNPAWPVAWSSVRTPLNALLRTRLVSGLCTPRHVDDYLQLADPTWSTREVRARVVAVRTEARDATSLLLAPNEHWRGFRAGQFVRLSADVNGVRYMRCFSLSSAPEDGPRLRVTLRTLPDGRISGWAARVAERGDVVTLSQAMGDFVLPAALPQKLLFISGGSGITPIASLVRHLLASGYDGHITALHYARREVIFGDELSALARRHDRFRFVPRLTRCDPSGDAGATHFSRADLERAEPDWQQCEAYLCGPAPLQAAVTQLFLAHGLTRRLHVERFSSTEAVHVPAGEPERCRIVFQKSRRSIEGHGGVSLLVQAEQAGLEPAFGCRMGICHTCKCRKLSGTVFNQLTGALSSEPDEEIQLCVNTPHSEVTLDL